MKYASSQPMPLMVSPEVFRRSIHLPADSSEDNDTLELLLQSAQQLVFSATGVVVGPLEYVFNLQCQGWSHWWFPVSAVEQVEGVRARTSTGDWEVVPASDYRLLAGAHEPQLRYLGGRLDYEEWEVSATVGVKGGVPEAATIRQAVILIAKEWFEAQIAVEETPELPRMSFGAQRLIRQIRYKRPGVVR